jgi:competence protein ComEC
MKYLSLIFLVLIGFNIFAWYYVVSGGQSNLDVYFLDVGQGDSELVVLPGGVQVLIDGGSDKGVLFELSKVLPKTDRYIDLVVMTHAQLDHFGGLYDVVERYKIGAFIAPDREGESDAWDDFIRLINEKEIPVVLVGAGDLISFKDSSLAVLSPNEEFLKNDEINESSVVLGLDSEGVKVLFTGDIGFETENYLVDTYDIDTDILKVGHHGSKFSTGLNFLAEATPRISVIEVGKNRFGHPTGVVLSRLQSVGSSIYRTDQDGTVHIEASDGVIGVSVAKN